MQTHDTHDTYESFAQAREAAAIADLDASTTPYTEADCAKHLARESERMEAVDAARNADIWLA